MSNFSSAIGLVFLAIAAGCHKSVPTDRSNWPPPLKISQSQDSLISGFSLHQWDHSLVALSPDSGSLTLFFLQPDDKTWEAKESTSKAFLPISFDPTTNRFLEVEAKSSGERMDVDLRLGQLNGSDFALQKSRTWGTDKVTMFSQAGPEVSFEGSPESPVKQPLWGALFNGTEIYLPYCVRGETIRDRAIISAEGPFDNGVLVSLDSGMTWNREHIDGTFSVRGCVCKTTGFYYFISGRPDSNELWFSQKDATGGNWTPSALITKTFATGENAVAQGDTVHVCWLDRKNEKRRLNPVYPWRENFEVVYSHRTDAGPSWSKPVVLSRGLLYSYRPMMTVESNRIVVAWAGVERALDGHDEDAPNDIFYSTSADGGGHWSGPFRVTDNVPSGLTAGCPKVALRNGVIHLFYIQGKISYKEVSAGLVKLNQPPWPIYYQQRRFPD